MTPPELYLTDRFLRIGGLGTAHSHAFQRALRGKTHRLESGASFWSWRSLMYRVAEKLTPESAYILAKAAYLDLAMSGVTAVGEFHYIQHGPGGVPYADRITMADATIRAALDVGLRITLLRVLYARAGQDRPPEGAQVRFCDASPDFAFRDVEEIESRWKHDPRVQVGVAPHSVRAVPKAWWSDAAEFAARKSLPLHAHVAEQLREIEECRAEHGRRPVELLADLGVLGPRFVAVHATHLAPHETALLKDSMVCLCRTTERDLGDGLANVSRLVESSVRICPGVDSHASSDPLEELRAIELDERVRTEARQVALDGTDLLRIGTRNAYAAIGAPMGDEVSFERSDPSLMGIDESNAADHLVFAGNSRAFAQSIVHGKTLSREGLRADFDEQRPLYETTLSELLA